jgi:hypothetical protein
MKNLLLVFLLLVSLQLVHAGNVLKNSDFADGVQSWHGDGRTPAEMKPQDSLDAAPDYGDKGLIIPLKPHAWTRVFQEFKTRNTSFTLNITYKLSPGASFSTVDEDYLNVPHSIDFDGWAAFDGKRGSWMTMVSNIARYQMFNNNVTPKFGATDQDPVADDSIDNLGGPDDEKTVCLAFPPGTGAVILLNVSLNTR